PLLATLLERYIELEQARERIEQRSSAALVDARSAVAAREAEAAKIERALAQTETDYPAGDLTGRQYSKREAALSEQLEGAQTALAQARAHAEQVESSGPEGDGEAVLLEHLAEVRAAVAEGVQAAPDLAALRNV